MGANMKVDITVTPGTVSEYNSPNKKNEVLEDQVF